MIHRFVINSLVMWLQILVGPCWCVCVAQDNHLCITYLLTYLLHGAESFLRS